MVTQITNTSVLKPHYQLMGMLLERQELRSKLVDFMVNAKSSYLKYDETTSEWEQLIIELDAEIKTCYEFVADSLLAEGRDPNELRDFLGDDLFDELSVVASE